MYSFYSTNELKPEGWLKRQLEIQAEGLAGNLDKVWPDVRDSAWIGGNREGWERVPYWLDGFIPLAYLLDNTDMKTRAQKYINAILSGQKEDGWICPCRDEDRKGYDMWALLLISKVLTLYYQCSCDERIPSVLYRAMKNFYERLQNGENVLFQWAKFRWYEGFFALNFLMERFGEPWIKDLARILCRQGFDYATAEECWKRPLNKWTLETHVVNLAMMLKTEAVTGALLDGQFAGQAKKLYGTLMQYNGTPVDIFTGDECLSGVSPIQGTELCSVAELMFSFENLYAVTGKSEWAERLEKVAFNALPAAITDDMWAHQYNQQSNQINAVTFPGRAIFRTNGGQGNCFGLEPNYGCCTANFGQAWPKLALSAFLHHDNTVLSAVPIPSCLKTDDLSIRLDTDYPFRTGFTYRIQAKKPFTLQIRIPSFAGNLTVNGKAVAKTDLLSYEIAEGSSEITVAYETKPVIRKSPIGLHTVCYGSFCFSLPIAYDVKKVEYERDGVERKFPYCDYEISGKSEWRYGLTEGDLTVVENEVSDVPFSSVNPPLAIRTNVRRINWDWEEGFEIVAAKRPVDTKPIGETEVKDFVPYGCAKLRITELPICGE